MMVYTLILSIFPWCNTFGMCVYNKKVFLDEHKECKPPSFLIIFQGIWSIFQFSVGCELGKHYVHARVVF